MHENDGDKTLVLLRANRDLPNVETAGEPVREGPSQRRSDNSAADRGTNHDQDRVFELGRRFRIPRAGDPCQEPTQRESKPASGESSYQRDEDSWRQPEIDKPELFELIMVKVIGEIVKLI